MQVRLDSENAKAVREHARTYQRIYKRRKSYGAVVNEVLRDLFRKTNGTFEAPKL